MIPVVDALDRVLGLAAPVSEETVPIEQACGRVLCENIEALISHPGEAVSAMDGYAVRSAEAESGTKLRVTHTVYAGPYRAVRIEPGETVRIFTGSPIPDGADAVAIQENVTCEDSAITLMRTVAKGEFVRPEGLDFKAGDTLLAPPRRLSPEDIALAAAANHARIRVRRKPRILVQATGDELVSPGSKVGPGQVVASTGYGVAALVERQGGVAEVPRHQIDDPEAIRHALNAEGFDVVVTLGGVSVGDRDFVGHEMKGRDLAFHGVRMRPGKPMLAGRLAGRPILGMPGNPVSAMVCSQVFLRPMIDALLGLPAEPGKRKQATLGCDLAENGPREHYMRARLEPTANGVVCTPFTTQDSSMLRNLARADALAIRPPSASACAAGSDIEYMEL